MSQLKEEFLAYCKYYAYGKERDIPLHDRTVGRYRRGLDLVEKIIGHSVDNVTNDDQLRFIEGIMKYSQGTRRVSTQIFQRFIAWCIKNDKMRVDNLIVGKEDEIIGADTPVSYQYISRSQIKSFFKELKNDSYRIAFGLVYYAGLTVEEIGNLKYENIQKSEIVAYREVRKESQIIPLSRNFMAELHAYAGNKSGPMFPEFLNKNGRSKLNDWYKQAQVQTGYLKGTTIRDLRVSGIRHFFEETYDIELTKEYAGVPPHKKGWLESLFDTSYYYRRKVAKARGYHEPTKEVAR